MITLTNAKPGGGNFTFEIDRGSTITAFTNTYTSATKAVVGATSATINFYDSAGGAGDVVATASAAATIESNGGGLDGIAVADTVQTVTVTPHQVVTFGGGSIRQLTFSAFDASNNLIAVSPGSATWTVASGSNSITVLPSGEAMGVALGSPTVVATVDGVSSAPTNVGVAAYTKETGFSGLCFVQAGAFVGTGAAGTTKAVTLQDTSGNQVQVPDVYLAQNFSANESVMIIKAGSNIFSGHYTGTSAPLTKSPGISGTVYGSLPLTSTGLVAVDTAIDPVLDYIVLPIDEIDIFDGGPCTFTDGVSVKVSPPTTSGLFMFAWQVLAAFSSTTTRNLAGTVFNGSIGQVSWFWQSTQANLKVDPDGGIGPTLSGTWQQNGASAFTDAVVSMHIGPVG